MPGRLLTIDEVCERLLSLGCHPISSWNNYGQLWESRLGRTFQLPMPEELPADELDYEKPFAYRYPDWLIEKLLITHKL